MRRYDSYKDSGVEWIGEIPEHWTVGKIKYSDLVIMGQSPLSDECNSEGKGLPFLQGNAEFGELFPTPKLYCETANKSAEINDVLLSVRAPVGAINISNQKVGIGRGLCAVRPIKSNSKFIYYWLLKSVEELDSISTGSTFKAVNLDDVKSLNFPIIGNSEQTAIVNYLDQKTTQIDDLIAKKERLIQLLEEERIAIINQAVTKGLDPTVPMKDSGIEWLGEIPAHWECHRIDWITNIIRGNTGFKKDELLDNGEYVALQYGKTYKVDIVDNSFNFFVNSEFYKESQIVSKGDTILISTSETIEDLGHVCYYDNDNIGLLGGEQILLQPNRDVLYEKYLFQYARQFSLELKKYAKGLKVFRFNTSDLKQLFIAIPSIEEQVKIADFIEGEIIKIDALNHRMSKEIELLKEYKTALISEVVTGKVDVRNEKLN
jgi:type I restriction enzyme S subunit